MVHKMSENVHHNFLKAKVMSSDGVFCLTTSQKPKDINLLSQRTKKNDKSSQRRGWNKGMFGVIIKIVADYFYVEHITVID